MRYYVPRSEKSLIEAAEKIVRELHQGDFKYTSFLRIAKKYLYPNKILVLADIDLLEPLLIRAEKELLGESKAEMKWSSSQHIFGGALGGRKKSRRCLVDFGSSNSNQDLFSLLGYITAAALVLKYARYRRQLDREIMPPEFLEWMSRVDSVTMPRRELLPIQWEVNIKSINPLPKLTREQADFFCDMIESIDPKAYTIPGRKKLGGTPGVTLAHIRIVDGEFIRDDYPIRPDDEDKVYTDITINNLTEEAAKTLGLILNSYGVLGSLTAIKQGSHRDGGLAH